MKEKLKENSTLAEKFDFLAKCARHKAKGGRIEYNSGIMYPDTNESLLNLDNIRYLTIHHEPKKKIVPYTSANDIKLGAEVIKNSNKNNRRMITGTCLGTISMSNDSLLIYVTAEGWVEPKNLLDNYRYLDNSPCGVEVEEDVV
jgi:hypothetical protein